LKADENLLNIPNYIVDKINVTVVLGSMDRNDQSNIELRLLPTSKPLINKFEDIVNDELNKIDKLRDENRLELIPYNPGYKSETNEISYLNINDRSIEYLKTRFTSFPKSSIIDDFSKDDEEFLRNLKFYDLFFELKNKKFIHFIFRYSTIKTINQKLISKLIDGTFDILKEEIYSFDSSLVAIITNNYIFIRSEHLFEQIFQFYKQLKEKSVKLVDKFETVIKIKNIEKFKKSLKSNKTLLKRFTEMEMLDELPKFNTIGTKNTIEKFNLSVKYEILDGEITLVFEENSKYDFVKLLTRAYLNSEATNEQFEVNSKRKL